MIKAFLDAIKIKDIKNRLLFTLFILIVVRLGSNIPVIGIDRVLLIEFLQNNLGEASNFLDAMTGGSLTKMSIFALNVGPYITSSIIMQLLTIAIPALEEMQKDGEEGRKKITIITRYLTIALAILNSIGLSLGFKSQGILTDSSFLVIGIIVVTLTTSSALVMWLGERITVNGVGNGISIILLINIVSGMPRDFMNLYKTFMNDQDLVRQVIAGVVIAAVVALTVVFVVILQNGERKIPVQYAQKMQGRKLVGGRGSHIPLKINTSGVIPVIFASSIMSVPTVVSSLLNKTPKGIMGNIVKGMNQNNWFNPNLPWASLGLIVYILLVVFFAYFYTSITFNPMEVANNMKKSGGFIPGIRPGKPTQEYLNKVLGKVVFIGVIGLVIVVIIPMFFNGFFRADVSFAGTSLIIIVGVIIETIKQIESKMIVRNYSGFLNN